MFSALSPHARIAADFFAPSRWFRFWSRAFVGVLGLYLVLAGLGRLWHSAGLEPVIELSFAGLNLTLIALTYFVLWRFFCLLWRCGREELQAFGSAQWLFWAILLFALFLRLYQIQYALPYLYTPDEDFFQRQVERIFRKPTYFSPKRLDWPGMAANLAVLSTGLQYLVQTLWQKPFLPYLETLLSSRLLMAFLGTAQVGLLMLLARRWMRGPGVWIAGLLASGHLLAVEIAHQARVDTVGLFFVTIWLYLASIYQQERSGRWLLLWGLSLGFMAGSKYQLGALALTSTLVLLIWEAPNRPHALRCLMLLALAALIGFWVATPLLPFRLGDLLQAFLVVDEHYQVGLGDWQSNALFFLEYLAQNGGGWAILSAGFLGLWGVRSAQSSWGLPLFLLASFLLLFGITILPQVRFERNLLPLLPFLSLGAGALGEWLLRLLGFWLPEPIRPKLLNLCAVIGMIVVLRAPVSDLLTSYDCLAGPDTRTEARTWILENLTPETPVFMLGSQEGYPQLLKGYSVTYATRFFRQPDWEKLKNFKGAVWLSGHEIASFAAAANPPLMYTTLTELQKLLAERFPAGPVHSLQPGGKVCAGPELWMYRF